MNSEASDLIQWKEEIEGLKRRTSTLPEGGKDFTAFYGSSSIRLWDNISEDLHPHKVTNLGFGGSSYFWCNHFFEDVFDGITPAKIILYAGDNDLGSGTPKDEIIKNIRSILTKIKRINNDVIIAVISVKPSPERSYLRANIEDLNSAIEQLMKETNNHFINIYPKMLGDNGEYRTELFLEDLLHMNEHGYEIWKKEVGNYLTSFT